MIVTTDFGICYMVWQEKGQQLVQYEIWFHEKE